MACKWGFISLVLVVGTSVKSAKKSFSSAGVKSFLGALRKDSRSIKSTSSSPLVANFLSEKAIKSRKRVKEVKRQLYPWKAGYLFIQSVCIATSSYLGSRLSIVTKPSGTRFAFAPAVWLKSATLSKKAEALEADIPAAISACCTFSWVGASTKLE